MSLRLFNSGSRAVEPFRTLKPNLARVYVCGPTVYDRAHLGHARSYVFYDSVKRALLWKGYDVAHVQNFTDVEESIKLKAEEAGVAPLAFADRLIDVFLKDMDALRVVRADHYPRVSDHVGEIQRIIKGLLDAGVAYKVDCREGRKDGASGTVCDVYFDVDKWPQFGELIGVAPDELVADRGDARGDRRHPMDFTLWKCHDDWGVTWPSPWGDGRPGWHVECVAMALKHLGPEFDLHGGGLDLVFPHHESEKAIAEAWTGQPYCRYYVHNGFVTVDERKMSKSKGNFVTLEDVFEDHDAEAVRVFLLSAHYRSPLNFDEEAIKAAASRLQGWRDAVARLRDAAAGEAGRADALPPALAAHRDAFTAAVDDDFHFDRALDAVDAVTRDAASLRGADAAHALAFLKEAADVLGVLWELESLWTSASG